MKSSLDVGSLPTGELVESVAAGLAELATREVTGPAAECLELVGVLGSALDLGEAVLAAMLRVADAGGEASAQLYAGTRGFLKVALGMRTGRADERLNAARQLPRLPRTAKSLACGELSFGYASAVCEAVKRLTDEDAAKAEDILLGMAGAGCSVAQVVKAGDRIADVIGERDGTEPAPDDEVRRGDRSWLQLSKSTGGGVYVKGRLAAELGALMLERLGRLARPAGPGDLRDHAERTADALEVVLSGGSVHWNATLIVQLEELRTAADPAPCDGAGSGSRVPVWPVEEPGNNWRVSARLADGTPIPIWRARQIALNAGISLLMLGPDGIPLYLGDKTRFVTTAQRRTLNALYSTCAFVECDIPASMCDIDHVIDFSTHHLTDVDLLAPCCSFHNRLKYRKADQVTTTRDTRGLWRYTIHRTRRFGHRRDTAGAAAARGP